MTKLINEGLKELLSYPETLALVCFNINYARRYEALPLKKLAGMLDMNTYWIEKAAKVLERVGMARLISAREEIMIEMMDPDNNIVKNTVFDVIWEMKDQYSVMYKNMLQGEIAGNA